MSDYLEEQRLNDIIKEFLSEADENTINVSKVKWYEDEISHITKYSIPMTLTIGNALYGDRKITTFHVSDVDNIDNIKNLVLGRKAISSFTFMSTDYLGAMRGVQTKGGILYQVIGRSLFKGNSDIMSRPDNRYKRWLSPGTVLPGELETQLRTELRSFWSTVPESSYSKHKDRSDHGQEKNRELIKNIAKYISICENFIKKNNEQIRKFIASGYFGSSWNEILVTNIEIKDVLWSSSKLSWASEYRRLYDSDRVLSDREEEFMVECVDKMYDIEDKLRSFITGEIKHTFDTKIAIQWVKNKGGFGDDYDAFKRYIKDNPDKVE
jgi:hypothetical protein